MRQVYILSYFLIFGASPLALAADPSASANVGAQVGATAGSEISKTAFKTGCNQIPNGILNFKASELSCPPPSLDEKWANAYLSQKFPAHYQLIAMSDSPFTRKAQASWNALKENLKNLHQAGVFLCNEKEKASSTNIPPVKDGTFGALQAQLHSFKQSASAYADQIFHARDSVNKASRDAFMKIKQTYSNVTPDRTKVSETLEKKFNDEVEDGLVWGIYRPETNAGGVLLGGLFGQRMTLANDSPFHTSNPAADVAIFYREWLRAMSMEDSLGAMEKNAAACGQALDSAN